ncbi:MAG: CBS domain-containing protein [Gammaproteobacteria bacterium]|nr:MAG: CBS domain-containing protein [Gammaproteobacteria bacterium]
MKITHYMSKKVITAGKRDGIRTTFFRMKRENIRHMPVLDEDNNLVGIISDRDLRRPDWIDEAPDLSHMYHLEDHLSVQDLMTSNPIVVHTYDKIRKANRLFIEHGFGALPVLDKDSNLVGILSAMDLLNALDDMLNSKHEEKKSKK